MDNIIYDELIKNLFDSVTEQPGVDMCGHMSDTAFSTLSKRTDEDTYFELEELMSAGFRENAFNGFQAGFRCAIRLLFESFFMSDMDSEPMDQTDYDIKELPYGCWMAAQKIGIKNLISLSEAMGGKELYIPKKDNLLRYFDRGRIKEDHRLGMTLQQIADKYKISIDTVRRVVRK